MTNPVADVVVPTTDKVKNGLFTPIFEVLHIGELQTGRFFDLARLVGPNGEDPNQTLRTNFGIGVARQFYKAAVGVFFGIHDLEKMNGNPVCSTIRQFGVGGTGDFVVAGEVEGVSNPLVEMGAFGIIGDEDKGVGIFDITGLFEIFYMKEVRQLGMGNHFVGFQIKHTHLPFSLSHNQLLTSV